MAWTVDARIAVTLLPDAAAMETALAQAKAAAVLLPEGADAPPALAAERFATDAPHVLACACCNGRSPAALALDRLFQARVRSQCGWFTEVLALAGTPEAEAQLQQALADDALTLARYRLAPAP